MATDDDMISLRLELIQAAVTGRVDLVAQLVARGADPNCDNGGNSLLCYMIANATPMRLDGVQTVMAALIEAGADINRAGPNNNTPLMTALQYDRDDLLTFLLAQGADPNRFPPQGASPLYLAAEADLAALDTWRSALLLEHGADPDLPVPALARDEADTVRGLLERTAGVREGVNSDTGVILVTAFMTCARSILRLMPPGAQHSRKMQKTVKGAAQKGGERFKLKGPRR